MGRRKEVYVSIWIIKYHTKMSPRNILLKCHDTLNSLKSMLKMDPFASF